MFRRLLSLSALCASARIVGGQAQQCSPGWVLPQNPSLSSSRCYKIIDKGSTTLTWVDARAQCAAQGGSLAALRDSNQVQDVVFNHCGGLIPPNTPVWIGLYWPPSLPRLGSYDATAGKGVSDRTTWRWENGADHTYITTLPGSQLAWLGTSNVHGHNEPDDFGW